MTQLVIYDTYAQLVKAGPTLQGLNCKLIWCETCPRIDSQVMAIEAPVKEWKRDMVRPTSNPMTPRDCQILTVYGERVACKDHGE